MQPWPFIPTTDWCGPAREIVDDGWIGAPYDDEHLQITRAAYEDHSLANTERLSSEASEVSLDGLATGSSASKRAIRGQCASNHDCHGVALFKAAPTVSIRPFSRTPPRDRSVT